MARMSAANQTRLRARNPTRSKLLVLAAICAASGIAGLGPARALDLNGAWATDASACQPDSDQYGGGFIVEGNKVRGQMQSCTIKARKEDGNVVHMLAACASDIIASNLQFSARVIDANTIARIFPGMPDELSINYSRCAM